MKDKRPSTREPVHPDILELSRKYTRYIQNARSRGLAFDVTLDEFIALVSSECAYCGVPSDVTALGIDRKDSGKGYTPGNSVPCCTTCNYMKGRLSPEQFVRHVRRIAERHPRAQQRPVEPDPSRKIRPKGSGTIWKRSTDGRFAGAVQIAGHRHYVYAHTEEEARAKLEQLISRLASGEDIFSPEEEAEKRRNAGPRRKRKPEEV